MRRILGLWVAVACGEILLLAVGRVGTAVPGPGGLRLSEPGSWSAWLAARPPEEAVVASVRLAGLAAGAYLLVVLGLGIVARSARLGVVARCTDRLTPRAVRALLDRSLGMAAAGAVAVTATLGPVAPAAADEGPPITLRGLRGPTRSAEPTTTTTVAVPRAGPVADEAVPVPVPVRAGEAVAITTTTTTHVDERRSEAPRHGREPPAGPAEPPPPSLTYEPAPAAVGADTWEVRRGDHFWSIAQRVLGRAWGRSPTVAEVDPYWRALVAENRPRLADPANVDLLFAGQVLTLPAPPPSGPG